MTKIRWERWRGEEGGGGGGRNGGGAHRVLEHTYPELSVARATLVFLFNSYFCPKVVNKS